MFTLFSINFYSMNGREAMKLKLILHMYTVKFRK